MNKLIIKKEYIAPQIIVIKLDNEISLQMESPATLPNESSLTPSHCNNSPFKDLVG
ncbi:MAG: hypothetical protein PHR83_02075 [Paludibacter sp.]|nr:hypothetical protein [Paludibacter sp.]